ncbi:MAG TPA: N-acetyltransferase family protein [Anaerolineaceae bacterium]|nr:N-acetyltransferase family protein [Anaerolineaceae bacterium]HPN50946.1 N-acetyltransferase family protein [Anaerolineaceae bacterium]
MTIDLLPMQENDWPSVARIYQEGIDTGHATFAPAPPSDWQTWQAGKLNAGSLVALENGIVLGWAALSPTSTRPVYAGVVETSLYVAANARGRGLGSALLQAVISLSESSGIWSLQAGIFPENQASLALFEHGGFRRVGLREKIGKMTFGPWAGRWRDVWLLERRSSLAELN